MQRIMREVVAGSANHKLEKKKHRLDENICFELGVTDCNGMSKSLQMVPV
jgi:hypothetical protein